MERVTRDLNINPDLKQQTLVATFERKNFQNSIKFDDDKMLKVVKSF